MVFTRPQPQAPNLLGATGTGQHGRFTPGLGRLTICGYREGIIVQLPFDHRICLGCMGLAIGKLQNAVYNHRPTNTNMQTAIDDAVRPLAERIATLELEMSALRQAIDGRHRAGVLPYAKTKTEAAREMLVAGRSNREVGTDLGLDSAQVKQIKYRLKKRRSPS